MRDSQFKQKGSQLQLYKKTEYGKQPLEKPLMKFSFKIRAEGVSRKF